MPVMTLTEAARELGYATRSQLKRLKDNGRIDNFIVKEGRKELIQTDGLHDHIAGSSASSGGNVASQPRVVEMNGRDCCCCGSVDYPIFGLRHSAATGWRLYGCINDAVRQIHDRD